MIPLSTPEFPFSGTRTVLLSGNQLPAVQFSRVLRVHAVAAEVWFAQVPMTLSSRLLAIPCFASSITIPPVPQNLTHTRPPIRIPTEVLGNAVCYFLGIHNGHGIWSTITTPSFLRRGRYARFHHGPQIAGRVASHPLPSPTLSVCQLRGTNLANLSCLTSVADRPLFSSSKKIRTHLRVSFSSTNLRAATRA
jgi:hypothetical protein